MMPVLVLTARDRFADLVSGFKAGADDFLTKPFRNEEVVLRLNALIRRAAGRQGPVRLGELTLDAASGEIEKSGLPLKLTAFERRMLRYLMLAGARSVGRAELAEHLYEGDTDRDFNSLEVLVSRLRRKIAPMRILSNRGEGYRLDGRKRPVSAAGGRSLERSVAGTLVVSIAAVMALALLLSVLLLKETIERRIDQRLAAAAAELQNAVSRPGSGGLTLDEAPADPVFEERGSGWGWLVREEDRILARSRSLGGGGLPPGGAGAVARVPAAEGEVRALTVAIRSAPGLSLTVAAPQQAVWQELAADIRVVAGAIVLLGAVLMAVAVWQARRALAPALALARDLERVREGALERLPDSGIREVAVVHGLINDLLAERRRSAAEARDAAAKLAHGLKTPLAVIAARADAGGAAPDAKVMEAVGAMQRLVAVHLAAARATRKSRVGRQRTLLRPIVEDLAAAFRHRSIDRAIAARSFFLPISPSTCLRTRPWRQWGTSSTTLSATPARVSRSHSPPPHRGLSHCAWRTMAPASVAHRRILRPATGWGSRSLRICWSGTAEPSPSERETGAAPA